MKRLDHPHIIKMFEFYIDDNNFYIVNEFCSEGDLNEKLHKIKFFSEYITKLSPSSHTLNIIYFFIIFLLIFIFLNYFYNFYF